MRESGSALMRFLKVGGAGKEVVECEPDVPLGRQAFEGPNTVSRALFALALDAEGGARLVCRSDASRLVVAEGGGSGKQTALRAQGDSCALASGDEVWLLGAASPDLRYLFDMDPAAAGPAKRARTKPEEEVVLDDDFPPSPPLPAKRAASGGGGGGFVPSPLKFYRNPVRFPGCDNARNCLDLRPFFGEPGLLRVCLTSYELDAAWMLAAFPVLARVPVAVACPGRPRPCPNNWRHVAPEPLQYGTAHGKLVLLYFADRLRVIVLTGNHIMSDHLLKSNAVWTQSFPLAAPSNADLRWAPGYARDYNDFGPTLEDYLQRLGLPPEYAALRAFDFADAAVALVSCVAGVHRAPELQRRYGYPRLAQVVFVLTDFF